ncbi:MAG: hypothetical protein ACRD2W_18870 [Acidimicrobiales bacterium]
MEPDRYVQVTVRIESPTAITVVGVDEDGVAQSKGERARPSTSSCRCWPRTG